jgi:hypothetical protein
MATRYVVSEELTLNVTYADHKTTYTWERKILIVDEKGNVVDEINFLDGFCIVDWEGAFQSYLAKRVVPAEDIGGGSPGEHLGHFSARGKGVTAAWGIALAIK